LSDRLDRLSAALADRYRIERELGAGGMATVYLAEDLKHDRKVAIKVLRPELAAVLGAERFVQEIKTTAQLQHPHILPLFDSGAADGFLFYVMPYIQGETLRDKLDRETQLGVDEAVRIAREVADALDYAHRSGVIHRDIKPENILLHDGRPMVADFGIALAVSAAAGGRMTETGTSIGTPHYMSPEQATADREITGRADIYSLASVLYEMLTGEPPHTGSTAQAVIMKIIADTPRPVTELRKSVPPNVAAAVMMALEKLPADRFESAKAFAAALGDPAFRHGALVEASAAASSRRLRTLVAWAVLGPLAGIGVGSWISGGRNASRPSAVDARVQLTFTGRNSWPAVSPDGDFVAYVDRRCEGGLITRCRSSLFVQEVGASRPVAVVTDAIDLYGPRWSHDGSSIFVRGELDETRNGIFEVPRLGGVQRRIAEDGPFDTHPAGDSIIVVGRSSVAIVDVATGRAVDSIVIEDPAEVLDVAWSPDGGRLALAGDAFIALLSRAGVLTERRTFNTRAPVRWSTNGDAVLSFRAGTVREDDLLRLSVIDDSFDGDPVIVLRRFPTIYLGQFDIARRSGRVVVHTGDARGDVWTFDIRDPNAVGTLRAGGTTWYGQPALSHDGRRVYYQRGDAAGDNAYLLDLENGIEEALTNNAYPANPPTRIGPDGSRIVFAVGDELRSLIYQITLPERVVDRMEAPGWVNIALPVGESAIAVVAGGQLALYSRDSDLRYITLPDSFIAVADADASPDGRSLGLILETPSGTAVLATVPVEGGPLRILEALPDPGYIPPAPSVRWKPDGTIYVGRWVSTDPWPSVWRFSEDEARLIRVAELRAPCYPSSIDVDGSGSTAACTTSESRSDIWAFDGLGR